MNFEELYRLVEEQNIIDPQETNWSTKDATSVEDMTNGIMQGALIDWQMRNAGYTPDDIKKYFKMRQKGMKHEEALKVLRPNQSKETFDSSKLEEININDEEGKRKAIKALADKIGPNHPDVKHLQAYLNLNDTMYSNIHLGRHNINITFIKESFVSGIYGDGDKKYSIDKLVRLVSDRKPKNISIDKVIRKNKTLETAEGNFLENIKKPNKKFYERVMRASTKYPIMLSEEGWIIDGSHRVSKLKWEGEKYIKAHIISKADLKKTQIFDDEELKKSEKV
jgi:hypothetical protein